MLSPVSDNTALEGRPTRAVIDTGALRHNYRAIRGLVGPATGVMAVVKANAYGHGDVEVSKVLEAEGCASFGVATVEEGERLRSAGVKAPVVVLGGIYPGQADSAITGELAPVVFDIDTARAVNDRALARGVVKGIHVKIDTGMGRLGLRASEVGPFFTALKGLKGLRVDGVMSHFVESESGDKSFSKRQLDEFLSAVRTIRSMGFDPGQIDIANSSGAVDMAPSRLDVVRTGIMLYGSYPAPRLREKVDLRPVMSVLTGVIQIKKVPPGTPISYGRTFVTERESLVATIPMGYADGLPRRLSGAGEVLVRGQRAPIVGLVCMDLAMVDVTEVEGVSTGDEVVVIGTSGREVITAEEVAEKAGTISYEIFCNISPRVPRRYV